MKRKLFFILFVQVALCSVNCHAQGKMSLDDCIKYALEHNVTIKQKDIDISIQQQTVKEKKNAYLPDAQVKLNERIGYGNVGSASGGISTSSSGLYGLSYTDLSVESSMPVYTGGSLKSNKRAAQFNLEGALANLEAARKDVSMQVAAKFLQALYYKNLAEVSRRQCIVSQELLDKAKAKVADGKSPVSDEASAASKLASDEYQLSQDEGNATLQMVSLAQLLTLPTPESFDITDQGLSLDEEPTLSSLPLSALDIYSNCANSYPTIVSAKAGISEAEANVKVAEAKRLPTVDFKANFSTNYYNVFNQGVTNPTPLTQLFDQNHIEYVGLYVTFPIFNRWATRTAINRAKLKVNQMHEKLEEQQQKLRNDIQQAYYNAKVAVSNYESARKAEEAAGISFQYEKNKYEAGRSTIYDLNQENQKWVKAQQDELQAKYEYIIRMKILEFYK